MQRGDWWRTSGPDDVWPATEPTAQLIDGYVEYRRPSLIARGGRLLLASRLEPLGFDGASVEGRWREASIELGAYGGWGLGRAAVRAGNESRLESAGRMASCRSADRRGRGSRVALSRGRRRARSTAGRSTRGTTTSFRSARPSRSARSWASFMPPAASTTTLPKTPSGAQT